jgi:hypothetical protein
MTLCVFPRSWPHGLETDFGVFGDEATAHAASHPALASRGKDGHDNMAGHTGNPAASLAWTQFHAFRVALRRKKLDERWSSAWIMMLRGAMIQQRSGHRDGVLHMTAAIGKSVGNVHRDEGREV